MSVDLDLAVIAGSVSTTIFAASMLPMLVKAGRSRDLRSYSLGNIGLANLGNAIHSAYVFSLPAGPIWVLHSFYFVSTALMLAWYVRYEVRAGRHQDRHQDRHQRTHVSRPPSLGVRSGTVARQMQV
ncbi:hypothetical protein [Actinotalea sp. Marseille-Q4924]|uniref:hypothetical protein n=1 Tax=Actinotalea sp. Marseille-Q4924 TaxID=2866571 RepID=UPI001CE3E987|nr:hypothetical protein [Actinotalea sp. Marseille-Q4924]